MVWFLVALAICLAGGVLSLAAGKSPRASAFIGGTAAAVAGAVALVLAIGVLISGESIGVRLPWSLPLASANMEIDPLSAVFVAAIGLVTILAAVYGIEYLTGRQDGRLLPEPSAGHAAQPSPIACRKIAAWFFFNLLAASMLLVAVARNGVLFLISWELMSLASFFLVMLDDQHESVRRAGWTYLVAMHLGTAPLVAMFLLFNHNGSLDFDQLSATPATSTVLFVLAVIGFGTKAGFIPMHVWLPEAHPAAPSHVSAVMSGVMIKTGIYGLLRIMTMLGPPQPWWGWTLVGIGVVSGVLGVLYALAQHDLKRLLAYHSVENIGIIALGLGVGFLGVAYDNPAMAALGFSGGLLHVVNHAIFKSLLFLGAGSVLHATGTREIDRLGGLLKRMPVTGATFLIGAAAISGLPPLNGFVSEFLIFLGAAAGLAAEGRASAAGPLIGVLVIGGLALIGGLAAACFAKAVGIVFLGMPRTAEAAHAHEARVAMRWPLVALAAACVLIGLSAPVWPRLLSSAVAALAPSHSREAIVASSNAAAWPLAGVVFGCYVLLGFIILLMSIRRLLLTGRRVERAVTWDCGYAAPTPRMQYTASSFARPLTLLFKPFLRAHDEINAPRGLFPVRAGLQTHAFDLFRRLIYEPLFGGVAWTASRLRWLQQGRLQLYVLYIALTILVLLIWKLG